MKTIAVLTTIDSLEQAREISRVLVERRLSACVQISTMESYYVWNEAVQHDDEYRLFIKTTDARYDDVEAAILELHPYELPSIYAFVMDRVFEPYAQWVAGNSAGI